MCIKSMEYDFGGSVAVCRMRGGVGIVNGRDLTIAEQIRKSKVRDIT